MPSLSTNTLFATIVWSLTTVLTIRVSAQTKTDTSYIDFILGSGYNFIFINPDSCRYYLELGKTLSLQHRYYPGVANYYSIKAAAAVSNEKFNDAHRYYDSALAITEKHGLAKVAIRIHSKIALLYQFKNDYIRASTEYVKAVRLLNDSLPDKYMMGLYQNLRLTLNNLQTLNRSYTNLLPAIEEAALSESQISEIMTRQQYRTINLFFPDGAVIKEISNSVSYVVFGGAKFKITGLDQLLKYTSIYRDIIKLPDGTVHNIPDIPVDGTIIGDDYFKKVFLIKNGKRYWITHPDVLEYFGGRDALCTVPPGGLKILPEANTSITLENVPRFLSVNNEFQLLADSIDAALRSYQELSETVSRTFSEKKEKIQQRKVFTWTAVTALSALIIIIFLLRRNIQQRQQVYLLNLAALEKEKELEQQLAVAVGNEKERSRIAADMHDDMGAGLSRIKFLSESIGFKKQLNQPVDEEINKIREYSHEMITRMGEIVWALNNSNDSLSHLLSFTRSYAALYAEQYGLKIHIDDPEEVPPIVVSGQMRRNIYLTVKEALHNTVKHAQASEVHIVVEIENKRLKLNIHDNGKGIDPNAMHSGNGLSNMRKRIEELGGQFSVSRQNGTLLSFTVPLNT